MQPACDFGYSRRKDDARREQYSLILASPMLFDQRGGALHGCITMPRCANVLANVLRHRFLTNRLAIWGDSQIGYRALENQSDAGLPVLWSLTADFQYLATGH